MCSLTSSIKKIDLFNSYLIIITGVLQWVAAPIFFKTFEEPSFWFFNGGITLVLLGFINIIRINYGTGIPLIRKLSVLGNGLVFAFWVGMLCFLFYKFKRYPSTFAELIFLALALLLSFRKTIPTDKRL